MSLTEKTARELSKQIVKDAGNVRVKQGLTNGKIVLHVRVVGGLSRTITCAADWEEHPGNERAMRSRNATKDDSAELLEAIKNS